MIELTPEQLHILQSTDERPPRVINPQTQETYLLVRQDAFQRMLDYDDGPWTAVEMDLLAESAGELLDKYKP
jgi:predicted homoserine dehydrogenase-like protein